MARPARGSACRPGPEAADLRSDLHYDLAAEAFRRFAGVLEPLQAAGRLGVAVFQFPRYFYPSRVSSGYLERVARQLPGVRVAVEFRQPRWMDEEHRDSTLSRHRLAYVCVDEPRGFPDTLPPVAAATADVAAVRFHGRNRQAWAQRDASPQRRYAYNCRSASPSPTCWTCGGRPGWRAATCWLTSQSRSPWRSATRPAAAPPSCLRRAAVRGLEPRHRGRESWAERRSATRVRWAWTRPRRWCCSRSCSRALREPRARRAALAGAAIALAATPFLPGGLPVLLALLGLAALSGPGADGGTRPSAAARA